MKRTLSGILVAFALLTTPFLAKGQWTFTLTWDTLNFPQPQTVNLGDTVHYIYNIHNNHSVDFAGPIYHMIRVDSMPADTLDPNPTFDTIPAFGSKAYDIWDIVTAQRYGGGINVVVIWPTAPQTNTVDTIYSSLTVNPVGRDDGLDPGYSLEVFPNPTDGSLFLRSNAPPGHIRGTGLYDLHGRPLFKQNALPERVDMNMVPAGVYILKVEDKAGIGHNFRVVKR